MLLFLLFVSTASAFNKAALKSGLQSTEGQMKLFSSWMSSEHTNYNAKEKAFRLAGITIKQKLSNEIIFLL